MKISFYLYHKSFLTGGTVLVAHPRGFPPTPSGPDSWEPAPEQLTRIHKSVMPQNLREVWIYENSEIPVLLGKFKLQ